MARTQTRKETWGEISDLLVFGPSPKKQPKIPSAGISEIYGIPAEILPDADEGPARDMVVTVRACKPRKVGTGRNCFVPHPHLTRDTALIKLYADDPATAARWAVIRDGKPYQPKCVNREADPRWLGDLGSLKDCRAALLMLFLSPRIEAFGVFPPDGEMVTFPVDPDQAPVDVAQAPDVSGRAPERISASGKSEGGSEPEEPETPVAEPESTPEDSGIPNPHPEASDATEVNSDAPRGNSGGTGSDNAL